MKMTQNLISVTLSEAELAEMDAAIGTLETTLSKYLIDLSVVERRSLAKMGDKSEAFCRQTLNVLSQNPGVVPASLDLAEAKRDLLALDQLRGRTTRLRQLLGRAEDTETALGSDVMSAALDGYALLKVLGKGSGLESLRRNMAARFNRSAPAMKSADGETKSAEPATKSGGAAS
jgi:hypothetical protein